jgi:hypothetical protein
LLEASVERIEALVPEGGLVLDVGGWAKPFARADWVIDLMPYETRGIYGPRSARPERFDRRTWVRRDICARASWPFEDDQFDFAVCSHTLEDVRDPIWVCSELNRVAKAGYVEVPSRLEEQSFGIHGRFVGWSHHRWLVDVKDQGVEFVFKPHMLHSRPEFHFPAEFGASLTREERVQCMFWEGGFTYREVVFTEAEELDRYLAGFVAENRTTGFGRRNLWRRLWSRRSQQRERGRGRRGRSARSRPPRG